MEKDKLTDHEIEAVSSFFNALASFGNKADKAKFLVVIATFCIGILRSLKGNQFVEGYLVASLKDESNVIDIEEAQVH